MQQHPDMLDMAQVLFAADVGSKTCSLRLKLEIGCAVKFQAWSSNETHIEDSAHRV